MQRLIATIIFGCWFVFTGCETGREEPEEKPINIVFIMADDLGYGDVQSFTPTSRIPTPNIDKLASQGLSFTNAHAPAAVCTPTRYSLLTGRYSWRSDMKKGVTWVWDGPLIDSSRYTIGAMLQHQGYHTACIGKWHLGMDWPTTDGLPATLKNQGRNVDYSKPIQNGPTDRGFDYYFGQEVPSFPPHAFIENDHLVEKPTEWLDPDSLDRDPETLPPVIPGAMAPGWRYEDLMYSITDKAIQYIKDQTSGTPKTPFFLYFAMSAPHTPIAPHEDFQGKTEVGRYGDYVYEMDYHVGRVIDVLDSLGISENTLVVFSSDNGGVNEDGLRYTSAVGDLVKNYGHNSSGKLRGIKSDAWEGGHRIPFIVKWPGYVKANSTSEALISQVDMMATFAALTGVQLPNDVAEDSYNMLPVFKGDTNIVRQALVAQSGEGILSIQKGNWKLVTCSKGGGKWSGVGELPVLDTIEDQPVWNNIQLYNMERDIQEQNNIALQHPRKVQELMRLLKSYIVNGRSTSGKPLIEGDPGLWREVKWIEQVR